MEEQRDKQTIRQKWKEKKESHRPTHKSTQTDRPNYNQQTRQPYRQRDTLKTKYGDRSNNKQIQTINGNNRQKILGESKC